MAAHPPSPTVSQDPIPRFPASLPEPPPFPLVDVDELDLDDELAESGSILLRSVLNTSVNPEQLPRPSSEPFITCTSPKLPLPRPTFAFYLTFADTRTTVTVPAHGLTWALMSPLLYEMSRSRAFTEETPQPILHLPVVDLSMPSRSAWPILHDYVYTLSTADLLSTLLAAPPSSATPHPPDSQTQLDSLVARLRRVQQLWSNTVALQISDEGLWETMRRAYEVLVQETRDVLSTEKAKEAKPTVDTRRSDVVPC
ncbi:hypothetical protein JCM11641_005038 [Rhodosporidiobolus odoratus]